MFDQVPFDTLFSVPQRNGLTKPKRLRGEGVKMVNMGELFTERRIQELPMDRVPCSERELETNRLEKGDLLFARQSLTLEGAGQSSIFLGDQEDVVFESHLIRCRLDKSRVDPLYYFYFFESKFGKQRIGSIVEQVAAAGIRGSDLIKLPVFLPSLSDQKAIAHILGTLDDKIELNQKMNQTLEEIAKAIFKSWFVDFDPVRAKAEGRPTGLPPEISDLFPDELVDSEVGEIPKGWCICEVRSFVKLNDQSWSKKSHPVSLEYLDLGNIKSNKISEIETYLWDEAPSRARRVLQIGDTIVGTVRPGNRSFGFVQRSGITGSTGFAVLTPLKDEYAEFVYLGVCSDNNIERLAHLADGAAYPAVSNEIILDTPLIERMHPA